MYFCEYSIRMNEILWQFIIIVFQIFSFIVSTDKLQWKIAVFVVDVAGWCNFYLLYFSHNLWIFHCVERMPCLSLMINGWRQGDNISTCPNLFHILFLGLNCKVNCADFIDSNFFGGSKFLANSCSNVKPILNSRT